MSLVLRGVVGAMVGLEGTSEGWGVVMVGFGWGEMWARDSDGGHRARCWGAPNDRLRPFKHFADSALAGGGVGADAGGGFWVSSLNQPRNKQP